MPLKYGTSATYKPGSVYVPELRTYLTNEIDESAPVVEVYGVDDPVESFIGKYGTRPVTVRTLLTIVVAAGLVSYMAGRAGR